MAMKFAFSVADTFQIRNRGLVLLSGPNCEPQARIFIGGEVELRRSDGHVRRAKVIGIEIADPNPHHIFAILVPSDVEKVDVPAGTQVWSDEVRHV